MCSGITIVNNPIDEEYDAIREKYLNKWVAIYQPDRMLTFERGMVVAFAEVSEDNDIQWVLQRFLNEQYGGGKVDLITKEDMEECYVVFRNVR